MKLKEYLEELQNKINKNPEILEYDVIYASDDEGNSYSEIHFGPTIFKFDGESVYNLDEADDYEEDELRNVICLN